MSDLGRWLLGPCRRCRWGDRGIAAARAGGREGGERDISSRGGSSSYLCGLWGTAPLSAFLLILSASSHAGLQDLFTARLACVLVAIAGVFELGATFEELEDQLIGLATHCLQKRRGAGGVRGASGRSEDIADCKKAEPEAGEIARAGPHHREPRALVPIWTPVSPPPVHRCRRPCYLVFLAASFIKRLLSVCLNRQPGHQGLLISSDQRAPVPPLTLLFSRQWALLGAHRFSASLPRNGIVMR